MNAAVQDENLRGLVVPDPWAVGLEPKPRGQFESYFHLVRNYVQKYTSEKSPVTKADFFRFAMFMSANGLSPKTVIAALRQLSSEGGGKSRWRRAAILDRLQWDMFRSNYRRLRPALSTFFLNSTAHYQHYYWRDHALDLFANKPSDDHLADHKDALRFGYQKMDEIVQECLDLAGSETSIVLCTALSQQPMFKYEDIGGKQVFKVHDIPLLMNFAGVTEPYKTVPVMAEQFQLNFDSEASAERAADLLTSLVMDGGEPLMYIRRDGAHVFAGCLLIRPPADDAMILKPGSNDTVRFDEHFYPLEGPKSGMHHPEGILWIRTPHRAHVKLERKVSLQEIAPTLLALCDVAAPVEFAYPPMAEVVDLSQRRQAA